MNRTSKPFDFKLVSSARIFKKPKPKEEEYDNDDMQFDKEGKPYRKLSAMNFLNR